jgi:hypothetical protein
MVEQFSTRAADPTFRCSILPRAPGTGGQSHAITGFQELEDVVSEPRIMVEQHIPIGDREGMPPAAIAPCNRLLNGTSRDVQNASGIMFNREEAIQGAEPKGRHSREVEGGNHLAMVVERGEPLAAFAFLRNALQASQIA